MADLDTLRRRGIPFRALVDGAGIAVSGTDTLSGLRDEGMEPICEVDETGTGVVGSETAATLRNRGIQVFCEVGEDGLASSGHTLPQLRDRGIPGYCIVGLDGIAQSGTLTIAQLRERGIASFCPVDEDGVETGLGTARITLTGQTVPEHSALNTVVGALATVNTTGTAAFTLTDTAGGRFSLTGNSLRVASATLLDYETNQFHSITVSVTGVTPTIANRTFLISVTDVVEPVITLTGTTVLESAAVNTTVGTLSLTGSSTGTPTYALVDSASGTFNLSGATLRTNALLNYETATSYNITVGVSGITPPAVNAIFAISVTNVLEVTLAALTLDDNSIAEDAIAGTVVGAILGKTSGSSLSLTDSDGGRYAISGTNLVVGSTALVAGTDSVTIRETHADGSNSPRDTVLSITVTAPLEAAPDALVLTWISGPSDNTPDIEAVGDIVEGDTIRFQFDTVNTFDSGDLETGTNTVDAAEDLAEELAFTIGALADDTWYARARIERPGHENSAWSNIVSETIVTTPSYTGPGDIKASAVGWWGLRAYSAAQCTGSVAAIRVVKASDGTAAMDINILTDGTLDVATIAGLGYAVKVTTLYDQSGGGKNLTNATLATMPALTLSAIGSRPALTFATGTDVLSNATGLGAISQPFTISLVFNRTSVGSYDNYFVSSSSSVGLFSNNSANGVLMYVGFSLPVTTAADTTVHSGQFVYNNTTGFGYVDGSSTSADLGNTAGWPTGAVYLGYDATRSPVIGVRGEVGIWGSAFSGGDAAAMDANQSAYWGV